MKKVKRGSGVSGTLLLDPFNFSSQVIQGPQSPYLTGYFPEWTKLSEKSETLWKHLQAPSFTSSSNFVALTNFHNSDCTLCIN